MVRRIFFVWTDIRKTKKVIQVPVDDGLLGIEVAVDVVGESRASFIRVELLGLNQSIG